MASTDHHAGFPGSYGDGLAAILAEKKTRESIWEAIKAGRTYAVTGDRIRCDFQINGVCMGGSLSASRRQIQAHVETEAPLDKIVLYKNGRAVRIINGEFSRQVNQTGCYKIRIEMGWGDPSLYHWEGSVKTGEGVIESFQTYFRGRSVLAPQKGEEYDESRINDIATFSERRGEGEIAWSCDTTGNKSTLHPCTSSVVIKVRGGLDTRLYLTVNGKAFVSTIRELLEYGYTAHMKYYHSQAFKVYRAVPETQYLFDMEFLDETPERAEDVYRLEVSQKNRQWAYISPIYVRSE